MLGSVCMSKSLYQHGPKSFSLSIGIHVRALKRIIEDSQSSFNLIYRRIPYYQKFPPYLSNTIITHHSSAASAASPFSTAAACKRAIPAGIKATFQRCEMLAAETRYGVKYNDVCQHEGLMIIWPLPTKLEGSLNSLRSRYRSRLI